MDYKSKNIVQASYTRNNYKAKALKTLRGMIFVKDEKMYRISKQKLRDTAAVSAQPCTKLYAEKFLKNSLAEYS